MAEVVERRGNLLVGMLEERAGRIPMTTVIYIAREYTSVYIEPIEIYRAEKQYRRQCNFRLYNEMFRPLCALRCYGQYNLDVIFSYTALKSFAEL